MKILMFVNLLAVGGTEKYILSLCRFLRSKGIPVGIATYGGPLISSARNMGITVHKLPIPRETLNKRIHSLYSIVKQNQYSLVHFHNMTRFAANFHNKHPKTPLLATVHGTYYKVSDMRILAGKLKNIVSVSPQLTRWMIKQGVPKRKIRIIPNGISTTQFQVNRNKNVSRTALGLPHDAKILVYTGRFARDKYPIAQKVILAAEIVARTNRNFIAVLYGPGSFRKQLLDLAQRVNQRLGRKAIWVRGALSKIQHAYYAADVVVGTGRVALEALACAKPVLAAGVSGYCGIVSPNSIHKIISYNFGDHGSLFPTSSEKLAKDLQSILTHPGRGRRLGKYASKIVRQNFSLNNVGNKHVELYRQLIRNM